MGGKGEPAEECPEIEIGGMILARPVFVAPQEEEIKNHGA